MANGDPSSEKRPEEQGKFEPLLAQLEKTVHELEEGDLSLDESLKRYVEAVELYRRCRKLLETAQKRVHILLEDTRGELRTTPFEVDQEEGPKDKSS